MLGLKYPFKHGYTLKLMRQLKINKKHNFLMMTFFILLIIFCQPLPLSVNLKSKQKLTLRTFDFEISFHFHINIFHQNIRGKYNEIFVL